MKKKIDAFDYAGTICKALSRGAIDYTLYPDYRNYTKSDIHGNSQDRRWQ